MEDFFNSAPPALNNLDASGLAGQARDSTQVLLREQEKEDKETKGFERE